MGFLGRGDFLTGGLRGARGGFAAPGGGGDFLLDGLGLAEGEGLGDGEGLGEGGGEAGGGGGGASSTSSGSSVSSSPLSLRSTHSTEPAARASQRRSAGAQAAAGETCGM